LPWLLNRISFSAAIIAVSVLVHLGFVGAIVLAERRVLPPSDLRAIDVDLVTPEDLEPRKEELPKPPEPKPPEPPKQALPKPPPQPAKQQAAVSKPDTKPAQANAPEQSDPEPSEQKQAARPETPQGGPAGGKSKLTPEEIASLRAQIQKCWKLPVGIPGMIGLEVVLRVSFGSKGQLAGSPVLLQGPASERGPMLVGIAMNAVQGCHPYKLPAAKYADWKVLDLKFTATGMAGLGSVPKLPKPVKG
jgi:hypothetical protein